MSRIPYTLKEYTRQVASHNPEAKATWVTASELLDLLNRVEAGDEAQAELAKIQSDEAFDNCLDEMDYADIHDLAEVNS